MTKTVQQTVRLPAPPRALYDIYMDARKHAAAVNSKVAIGRRVGGTFRAFGGMLRGKVLALVPGRMIVQTWRSKNWKRTDLDSILILTFRPAPGGGRVDLVHANVPDRDYPPIKRGWNTYYWKRWRAYLRRRG
ncbi:MAG: SRPBCC domain-containing protein [candidate division NC10 bacterium]|nr:SRPBCC domain-containing protein [candidate division NC10 bacterium]